jgi:hypothetical protein|eukprot:COSAG02_NODE_1723_length_11188_cov_3.341510_9_plen_154_part_00
MAMHQDQLIAHVWGLQLAGRKRFVFCPESELPRCVASNGATVDAFNSSTWGTAAEPAKHDESSTGDNADMTGISAFRPAACFHVSLEPGDLVYWPSRWLHQSYQEERSVALSSFSLSKNISAGFFESMDRFFAGAIEPRLAVKMRSCSKLLPK